MDDSRSLIPTLHKKDSSSEVLNTYDTAETKAAAFAGIFFPPRPMFLPPMPEDSLPACPPLQFTMPALHQVIQQI